VPTLCLASANNPLPPSRPVFPSPDPSFATENNTLPCQQAGDFRLVLAHRKKVEKREWIRSEGWYVRGGVDVACLENTGLSFPPSPFLLSSLSLSALFVVARECARARSTACGRPRLASGLYRDYICKTIRLNHFLNKRARHPLPRPDSGGSGSDRRAIPACSRLGAG